MDVMLTVEVISLNDKAILMTTSTALLFFYFINIIERKHPEMALDSLGRVPV